VTGNSPDSALQIESRVREALRPMNEIVLLDIDSRFDDDTKSIFIFLTYDVKEETEDIGLDTFNETQQLAVTVSVPFVSGG
jgi:hypothetical protein